MTMKLKRTATLAGVVAAGAIALAGCFPPAPPPPPPPAQFAPGLWHTVGVAPGAPMCKWARNDKTGNPIGSGWTHTGPEYAQIEPASAGDASFVTSGCQKWVVAGGPLDAQYGEALTLTDGVYRVGVEVDYGVWTFRPGNPDCHWERLRGFRGEAADVLSQGSAAAGSVTVVPGDVGFSVRDCGTLDWSKS